MIRGLTSIHRWLAIPLAPFLAMWFASGIVMHVVPFPRLTEAERVAGLVPLDLSRAAKRPADAVAASRIGEAARVRLVQRSDGPVYVVDGRSGVAALHADDLSPAPVTAPDLARAIALDHARQRGLSIEAAGDAQALARDQWTVAGDLDRHRPLYRVALNDDAGTELYVSGTTGEVVRDTIRRERWWNALGSIPHWLYPTPLRGRPRLWTALLWSVSLAATIAALAGSVLGIVQISRQAGGLAAAYRGWHCWHHLGGLVCMVFVLAWTLSGWLSMDDGRLFPGAQLTSAEAAVLTEAHAPAAWPRLDARRSAGSIREIEWFWWDGTLYERDRLAFDRQRVGPAGSVADAVTSRFGVLTANDMALLARRLGPRCAISVVDARADAYAAPASMPDAPVYRLACDDVWFHIDGASGALIERVDPSRRAYRWLWRALHTWDVPALIAHPALRTALIVGLCGCGLAFSLTGCVIGWRRLCVTLSGSKDRPAG
ncbi:MAG TPA: PepSY domain-containing protein [Xanthobacteraceae bacterium]|nr:PepSY domain-containing protein [Xanthobacteraceae bacterium]